jgi:hypothetical protein
VLRLKALFLGLMAVLVAGFALGDEAIANWPAPATWSPHSVSRGVSAMGAITSPFPFIGVTPCRQYDSRNFTPLPQNTSRAVVLSGAPCGLPASAVAVSVNLTIFNISGATGNGVFQVGIATAPTFSWINFPPTEAQRGNAGALPLDSLGQLWVRVQMGGGQLDFTVDVNGYYASAGVGTFNTFLGRNAGNFTMTGDDNTGLGHNALFSNTTGFQNTAIGEGALSNNTTGFYNTATGFDALALNTMGDGNTANGAGALLSNTTGSLNTATGISALINNTMGDGNTATGYETLSNNTTGFNNTATGYRALGNTTGSLNIGIGNSAGFNLTTGSYNICIGNSGVAGESGTIRIGSSQTATFVAGVNGVTTGGTGTPVLIDANGQLGTISSSARFKDEIQDMGEATEGLLRLRPVTFRYKTQPEGRTQFGLIAEEVEKVMPELVVCSSSGEVETVLYHEMPAMLLNELQKQQRQIEELKLEREAQKQHATIEEQRDQIRLLEARLAALEEQFREEKLANRQSNAPSQADRR